MKASQKIVLASVLFSSACVLADPPGLDRGPSVFPHATSNEGVFVEAHPEKYQHVYAMSDAHGMHQNLIKLLKSAHVIDQNQKWSAGKSLLLVLGDSIDKGPETIEVIQFWMDLQPQAEAAGGKLVHLLGNHEAEFLANPLNDKKAIAFYDELNAKKLDRDTYTDDQFAQARFLHEMPVAAHVGNWLFAHSGYIDHKQFKTLNEFSNAAANLLMQQNYSDDLFIGKQSILEAKKWWAQDSSKRDKMETFMDHNGIFGLVFGHQPKALNVEGADAISQDQRLIKVDNGMAPEAGSHPGSVLMFINPVEMNRMAPATVFSIHSGAEGLMPLQTEQSMSTADDSTND